MAPCENIYAVAGVDAGKVGVLEPYVEAAVVAARSVAACFGHVVAGGQFFPCVYAVVAWVNIENDKAFWYAGAD